MLLEHQRAHVRLVDYDVDDREIEVRKIGGDFLQRLGPGESGHDDRIAALLGEAAQRLLALRGVRHFELDIFDAGFGLELLGPVVGRLVERFVELAAEIIEQRRLRILRHGLEGEGGGGQQAEDDTFHVIHTLSVRFLFLSPDGSARGRRQAWRKIPASPHCG